MKTPSKHKQQRKFRKQKHIKLCTYRFYKVLDYMPILNLIGMSERIKNNCMSIYYGDCLENLDFLWHETFDMIYYDITRTVPVNNVTFNTAHETKIMKWQLAKLHEKNNGKELTAQQWLNIFQSKVRTLPDEPKYVNLMYAHWLYNQYVKSMAINKRKNKEN